MCKNSRNVRVSIILKGTAPSTVPWLILTGFLKVSLIDGHGNFGTTDDEPAAMRYTEARLAPMALYLLEGLKKNAVDFVNNYDDSEKEPVCLPAVIPNLLINGTSGIAVGMASDIPPHNLSEVIEAVKAYIANEKLLLKSLWIMSRA